MLDVSLTSPATCDELLNAPGDRYQRLLGELAAEIQARVDVRLAQGFTGHEALAYAAPLIRAARRARALRDTVRMASSWPRAPRC